MANRSSRIPTESLWRLNKGRVDWSAYKDNYAAKWTGPDDLWAAATAYFAWAEANPILTEKSATHEGEFITHEEPRARVFTVGALCVFIGLSSHSYYVIRKDKEHHLYPAVMHIDEVIKTQKYEGAAVGVFNANMIARDLGLAEVQDHKSSDGSMSPTKELHTSVDFGKMSPKALEELHMAMPSEGAGEGDQLFGPIKDREE